MASWWDTPDPEGMTPRDALSTFLVMIALYLLCIAAVWPAMTRGG